MAARHFSFKTGKLGAGAPHAEYIAGIGKYSRDDVCHLSDHNLPEWAADGCDFFAAADANERANGRCYSEIEFAIPRSATDPVAYALKYADDLLGDRHVYRLAVHDKLASDGGRNVHAHLMFSERRLDGIDRDRELFFRRANTKHPERGGAAKDRTWNDRQHIDRLRRGYEAHAKAYGISLNLRSNEAQGLGPAEEKIGPQKRRGDKWRDGRLEQVTALRQRRRKTCEEIRDIKAELREARRERARRDICACHEATEAPDGITFRSDGSPWYHSPIDALTAERRNGRAVFRWSHGRAAGLVAIIDRGNLLSLAGKTSMPKVQAVVALARARGWESLRLTGSDEFKRLAAREALREGLTVVNPELAEFITTQLQMEIQHGQINSQQHPAGAGTGTAPRRRFTAWSDGGENRQGMRVSRRLGPERMPALHHAGSGHGLSEASDPLLQGVVQGYQHGNHSLFGVCPGDRVNPMDQSTTARPARIELARRWLTTAAPLDAMEAAKLRADPDRLLQLFDMRPEARQWERMERQRAQGIPEALLGLEIDRSEPTGPFQGVVRHVGKRVWIEPQDRPGVVVSVSPSQPVRPGQQVVVRRTGKSDHLEIHPIRERDNTPRP